MRVAIANQQRGRIGGVESYLHSLIPELLEMGYEVGFFHEVHGPPDRGEIGLPASVSRWCVSDLGVEGALAGLREWKPDLVFTHVIGSTELEAELLRIAPGVFFAHAYYGTCISGLKSHKLPTIQPCQKAFGWQCLVHYFPRRCGGLSPLTMAREYQRNSERLQLIRNYSAVVVNSRHMRAEYINNGVDPAKLFYATPVAERGELYTGRLSEQASEKGVQLVFSGRMDRLKGGLVLLEAAPRIAQALQRPVRLTFSGDGPDRLEWETYAREIQASSAGIQIEFAGWLAENARDRLLLEADLLVVPSLWPEPFGLVGPEAGLRGLPAAGFAVGGITDWLAEGVNGHLASGHPPTASALADAVVRCLSDPVHHRRLRKGAQRLAQRYTLEAHLIELLQAFREAAGNSKPLLHMPLVAGPRA